MPSTSWASAALLVLSSPLFAAIAVWIKLDSTGPVLFRQTRLGLDQRPFTALKFRTMRSDTSADDHRDYVRRAMSADAAPEESGLYKLERPDDVTRAGRLLRKTSLDELPQLLNVVRGDMSLVGPRPCISYETEHFAAHHFERFSGPGRAHRPLAGDCAGALDVRRGARLDVLYARSWSLGVDLALLLQTPLQIFRPKATPMSELLPVNIAVVGLGYWGPNVLRNLYELEEAEVVHDLRPARET